MAFKKNKLFSLTRSGVIRHNSSNRIQKLFLQLEKNAFVSVRIDVELGPAFQFACPLLRFTCELGENEATVKGLLLWLSKEYGEKMTPLLFERGENSVLSGLMVMVNDQVFTGTALNQQKVPLREGDRVSLLYFVSGG